MTKQLQQPYRQTANIAPLATYAYGKTRQFNANNNLHTESKRGTCQTVNVTNHNADIIIEPVFKQTNYREILFYLFLLRNRIAA